MSEQLLKRLEPEIEGPSSRPPLLQRLQEDLQSQGVPPPLPADRQPDTTPIPIPEQQPLMEEPDNQDPGIANLKSRIKGQHPGIKPVKPLPETVQRAADAGVAFDKPLEEGHFLSSLAWNRQNKIKAYEKASGDDPLKRKMFRVGPETGEIEYYDPDTNRFALASVPFVMDPVTGMASMGGTAITMTPEIIGGGAMAAITRHPVLANLGASGGAFVGEIARMALGKRLGINEDLTTEQLVKEAGLLAGISFAAGYGADKVFRIGKFIADAVVNPGAIDRAALKGVRENFDEASEIAAQINKHIEANKLSFNVAQATKHEDLLTYQEVIKRHPVYQNRFREFTDNQQKALVEFWDNIHKGYRVRGAMKEQAAAGEAVQARAGREADAIEAVQDDIVRKYEADLSYHLNARTGKESEPVGPLLRDIGGKEQEAFNNWADTAIAQLDTVAGNEPFILNKNLATVVRKYSDQIDRSLLPSLQQPKRRLIGPEVEGKEAVPEDLRALRESITGEPQPETADIVSKIFDPTAKFTFREVWDAMSALGAAIRPAAKGLSTEEVPVGVLKDLRAAMWRDIEASSNGTGLAPMFDRFRAGYAKQKARLDKGAVGAIMERREGVGPYKLESDKVFDRMVFSGSRERAEQVQDLIQEHPAASERIREAIVQKYRDTVYADGKFNRQAHMKFMRDHRNDLPVWFEKTDRRWFGQADGLAKALEARREARDRTLKQINATDFGRQIQGLRDPASVVNIIMDPKDPSKARRLMQILKNNRANDDVIRALRYHVRTKMSQRVFDTEKGGIRKLNHNRFHNWLDGKGDDEGYASVLREIFGPQYVNNLRTLDQALQIAARETAAPNFSNTAFWGDTFKGLIRAYVGLFTTPGRFLTAADRIRQRAAQNVISKAMLNPEDLESLIKLRGVDARTSKAVHLLGNLGGTAFVMD